MNLPATVKDYRVTCFVCREQWTIRLLGKLPKQCPRCGSRHWNEPAAALGGTSVASQGGQAKEGKG